MSEQTNLVPEWMEGKKINESLFCREYQKEHPMIAISGTFFTVDGRVTDEAKLMRDILEKIEPYVTSGLSRKVQNLLEALRLMCYSDPLPVETDRIHVANGTYFLDSTFREEKVFCMNRLPVSYDPAAPVPEKWLAFLQELLYPEDIPTLQEYMGYCLIPSNKGQTVSWIEAHNERQKESYASNPDIHLERSQFNFHLVEPQGKYLGEADRMIREAGCRTRKDSVKVVEALITASPEFFMDKNPKEIRLFFQRAVDFMKTRQDEATYISAVVHVDEKTPHMHLCFVPITPDDRLSAKEIVGNKKDLTKWQDDFWSYMVKFYPDLERGESASKTGRAHIPPRLFKDAVHLGKLQDKILDLFRDPNPLTAKKRAAEVEKLLGKYIPRAESLMSSMKKINRAIKELKAEVKALEKQKEASQESVLRKMEIMQQLQELEELKELIENIPDEILDTYKNKENLRKENEIAYE